MKKLLLILSIIGLIACLLVGCGGVTPPPTEGEGEGEGEGEVVTPRVVLVEIFSAEDCPHCEATEPFLEQLAGAYNREEMVLVEERAWGLYSSDEIKDRYKWYFPSEADRSTPNILFNGLNQRLHGVSTYAAMDSKIQLELNKEAKISITNINRISNSTITTISGTIKNISTSTLSSLVVNGITFKDLGGIGLNYGVTDILEEQKETVATLEPEGTYNFSFTLEGANLEGINWDGNNIHGVIFVQAVQSSTKEILQSIYIE
jgi:thiol-disulfide isomerase/thioredoxin